MTIETADGILFDKIGGWLVFPAFIHPIIGVIVNLQGVYDLSQTYSDAISANAKIFLIACMALSAAFAIAWVISAFLAGSLNRAFPNFYVVMNIVGAIAPWMVLAVIVYGFEVAPSPQDYSDALKNVVAAIIWVPYILISKRVKATFYDVPMPQKLAYKNVSSPLAQSAMDRQQMRYEPFRQEDIKPLSMVQRAGMVLYWAGAGLAAILAVLGLFALANASDRFIAIATLVAAGVSWLVGRALKYILVGR